MPPLPSLDAAFAALRARLGVRTSFPTDVLAEAERVARERDPSASPVHPDRTALPFVTIDPPGSRDLDQALHLERSGTGYTVRYAIADVGFWVDRGSGIEAEAWQRGVTFYAPDERERLYPPALSEGAASLLPDHDAPAVLFTLELDERAEIRSGSVERARVRSRAQLTYAQVLAAVDGASPDPEWLPLLREIGELRVEREAERGGVSLPILDQHVQRRAAAGLGYVLAYDEPNRAEEWNAQISLLTGHFAALEMLRAGVGLLRTMPAFERGSVRRFRALAKGLGFQWPKSESYAHFIRGLDLDHPNVPVLLWQAQRTMRGAAYVAFEGEPPEHPLHAALAFPYAHATAPLRRLADRYVLDLLVELDAERRPEPEAVTTLRDLPPVMREAQSTENRLEREVVNLAEAWTLRDRVGDVFPATVIGEWRGDTEVQLAEPPVRALLSGGGQHELGGAVTVRVAGVDPQRGRVKLRLAKTPGDG